MLLFFVIAYLIATVAVGFWASRKVKTSGDFMLAGRSLPMVLSTSALFATWFGSETVFGASSEFLKGGLYSVIEDPFGAALCLILFGFFFARKLYQMNLLTLGDFFKVRFGPRTELIASLFMVPAYFGYTAGQLVALGLIINVITGLAVWQGVVVSAMVVTLYTYVGGMWAISITDFIQSIIIVVGLAALAWVLGSQAGGAVEVISAVPKENFRFFPKLDFVSIAGWMAAWSVLGLGSIPSQDVFQRAMSSGSARVAERSCYYAAGLYLTVAMIPLFISLCIKHLYPEQITGDTQLTLPMMVLAHTSLPIQILFFGSLLSAVMSTTSSSILAPAALISENIVKPLIGHKISDQQFMHIARVSILIFSAGATLMACTNSNIYELVGGSSILSLVSLFVPMVFGLYWKRTTSGGAILSMTCGMLCWILLELFPVEIPGHLLATLVSLAALLIGSMWFPERKYE